MRKSGNNWDGVGGSATVGWRVVVTLHQRNETYDTEQNPRQFRYAADSEQVSNN